MSAAPHPVAIITGGKRGIGADVAAAFRRGGYAVVATSRSIPASDDSDVLTVQGDITDAETSRRVVEQALERFGRIDSLINNAGVYIGKPFTDYTSDDYAAITAVNLAGFFNITQQAIGRWSPNGDQTKLAMLTDPTASSSCGSLIANTRTSSSKLPSCGSRDAFNRSRVGHELALRPGFSAQSPNATDGATRATRREAWVTGFDCGAGAVLLLA